jgi:hypothetical protein
MRDRRTGIFSLLARRLLCGNSSMTQNDYIHNHYPQSLSTIIVIWFRSVGYGFNNSVIFHDFFAASRDLSAHQPSQEHRSKVISLKVHTGKPPCPPFWYARRAIF